MLLELLLRRSLSEPILALAGDAGVAIRPLPARHDPDGALARSIGIAAAHGAVNVLARAEVKADLRESLHAAIAGAIASTEILVSFIAWRVREEQLDVWCCGAFSCVERLESGVREVLAPQTAFRDLGRPSEGSDVAKGAVTKLIGDTCDAQAIQGARLDIRSSQNVWFIGEPILHEQLVVGGTQIAARYARVAIALGPEG